MKKIEKIKQNLIKTPKSLLITGVAGFIGSNLLETLLELDQKVVGLDNFSAGYGHNLDMVRKRVPDKQWQNFEFVEADIRTKTTDRCLQEWVQLSKCITPKHLNKANQLGLLKNGFWDKLSDPSLNKFTIYQF